MRIADVWLKNCHFCIKQSDETWNTEARYQLWHDKDISLISTEQSFTFCSPSPVKGEECCALTSICTKHRIWRHNTAFKFLWIIWNSFWNCTMMLPYSPVNISFTFYWIASFYPNDLAIPCSCNDSPNCVSLSK